VLDYSLNCPPPSTLASVPALGTVWPCYIHVVLRTLLDHCLCAVCVDAGTTRRRYAGRHDVGEGGGVVLQRFSAPHCRPMQRVSKHWSASCLECCNVRGLLPVCYNSSWHVLHMIVCVHVRVRVFGDELLCDIYVRCFAHVPFEYVMI
jgi:hypothetical protein